MESEEVISARCRLQAAALQYAIPSNGMDFARDALMAAALAYARALAPKPWQTLAHGVRQTNALNMRRDAEQSGDVWPAMGVFYWLALAGEVGEGCNLVKKYWRDGLHWTHAQTVENSRAVREELCDVRIYVEALADLYGMDLDAECERKMREVMKRPFAQPSRAE